LIGEIRALDERFAAREAADPDRFPGESLRELIALGVLSAPLPQAIGGIGASLPEAAAMIEVIAQASPSLALLLSMPVGLAGVLASAGDVVPEAHSAAFSAQVERIAAEYRDGKIYAACNSEKGAGGSIAATRTTARRARAGEQEREHGREQEREQGRDQERGGTTDGGYLLTGEKILASFGRYADVFFSTAKLPEGGVEFFLVDTKAPGVEILTDWDGFGMRSTESHAVRYDAAQARALLGFPGFIEAVHPLSWWWCLFAAIPLGCAASILRALGTPAPASPAVRLRLSEALMRYEAARAYLMETAAAWRPGADAAYRARVTRTKTYVTQEATRLCADLFALSGGRHYTRASRVARTMADSFAGTALRPPLALALDMLIEGFSVEALW
jgi:alkylation response protein AidB-like acyl-CoA dehydrogenase